MRWPWRPRPVPSPAPDLAEASEELRRTVAQREQVESLGRRLREHREMNHFADLVFRTSTRGGEQ